MIAELTDLASKNTEHPVKLEFQKNKNVYCKYFL